MPEAADLAAADTWPGGSPTEEMMREDEGSNVVIARTAAGTQLLDDAIEAGYLVSEGLAAIEDLNEWQPHQVRKKIACEARFEGMRREGQLGIRTVGLRTPALRSRMSERDDEAQIRKTRERIAIGKHLDDFGARGEVRCPVP